MPRNQETVRRAHLVGEPDERASNQLAVVFGILLQHCPHVTASGSSRRPLLRTLNSFSLLS